MNDQEKYKELNKIGFFSLNGSEIFDNLSYSEQYKYLWKHRKPQFISSIVFLVAVLVAAAAIKETFFPKRARIDDVAASAVSPPMESKWRKSEKQDPFTDKVTKSYLLRSTDYSGDLRLACSQGGKLGLYYNFQPQDVGYGAAPEFAKVRIDSEPPYDEAWTIFYTDGSSTPKDRDGFLEKLKGRSKFAIEIFAGGTALFEIAGFDQALADMQATPCEKGE